MKLRLKNEWKSISQFSDVELPAFTILTGLNGSGKSHLLDAIQNGAIQIDDIPHEPKNSVIRKFDWTTLIPNDSKAVSPQQLENERNNVWSKIRVVMEEASKKLRTKLATIEPALNDFPLAAIAALSDEEILAHLKGEQTNQTTALQNIRAAFQAESALVKKKLSGSEDSAVSTLERLSKILSLPIAAIDEDTFYGNFTEVWKSTDQFQQTFSKLFLSYHQLKIENEFKAYLTSTGQDTPCLTEDEFLQRYGEAPWIFVNKVLQLSGLDFSVTHPAGSERRPFEATLEHKINGQRIKFADLSSGEKVLMSFALCLYYAEDTRHIVTYPRVLLFDEIDAPLHPSMSLSLLHAIQDVLVTQKGIQVILTTHSPSTVAMAPEESIYAMQKTGSDRVLKTSKDRAIGLLTTGVPTLSVSFEKRRQIFVESRYDAEMYESLLECVKGHIDNDISLTFIGSGKKGEGSCAHVVETVGNLKSAGATTVYGIIDWDLKNRSDDRVKVLCEGVRYNIENFILDPLLVVALLLRDDPHAHAEFKLESKITHISFSLLPTKALQDSADLALNKIRPFITDTNLQGATQHEYLGGHRISLPIWFTSGNGHFLDGAYKQAFPKLCRYHQEHSLKKAIIERVAMQSPEILPKSILSLFEQLKAPL